MTERLPFSVLNGECPEKEKGYLGILGYIVSVLINNDSFGDSDFGKYD